MLDVWSRRSLAGGSSHAGICNDHIYVAVRNRVRETGGRGRRIEELQWHPGCGPANDLLAGPCLPFGTNTTQPRCGDRRFEARAQGETRSDRGVQIAVCGEGQLSRLFCRQSATIYEDVRSSRFVETCSGFANTRVGQQPCHGSKTDSSRLRAGPSCKSGSSGYQSRPRFKSSQGASARERGSEAKLDQSQPPRSSRVPACRR